MDPVDITIAILLGYAVVRGYTKGLLGTAAGYVAPVLAFLVASDWSDPVRDRLAEAVPAPDFVVELAAPALVFLAVVIVIRTLATLASKLLGVGMSAPSRVVAAAAGGAVTAALLGAAIVLVHEMVPERPPGEPDDAGEVVVAPVAGALQDIDRRLAASTLGPALSSFASAILSEAMLQRGVPAGEGLLAPAVRRDL